MDHPDRADEDPLLGAQFAEYVAIEAELDALRILRNDRAVADAAMAALGELAERGDGYTACRSPTR